MWIENKWSSEVLLPNKNMLEGIKTPSGRELSKDIQNNFSWLSLETQAELLPRIIATLPSIDADISNIDRTNSENKMIALGNLIKYYG